MNKKINKRTKGSTFYSFVKGQVIFIIMIIIIIVFLNLFLIEYIYIYI